MKNNLVRAIRYFVMLSVFGTWFSGQLSLAESVRPNVVVILADDQGWGDLSIHGNKNLKTPSIDSLATSGATLDRFYVCAVCSPTRAEFFTGRYHTRGGVFSTSKGGERLNLSEKTIGDMFKAAGYATGAFGKWHNGMQYPYHPNARGFDEFYGFCSGHWGNYFNPSLEHNGKLVKGQGYLTDDLCNHAMEFIEKNQKQPFFCYIPLNTPHSPMQVPDQFYKKFAGTKLAMEHRDPAKEEVGMTRAALAMCENIDWNVGRVLKKLDDLELSENTIVIYFSDNGPNSWRWNGDMRGKKGHTDEGGVRAPCFIRWPNKIAPGTKVTQISAAFDLLPTLADMTNTKKASDAKLDGRSLKPLLFKNDSEWSERLIFSHWNGKVSVRTQRYRLDHKGKLFDMQKDPGQRKNLSKKKPKIAKRLRKAVEEWKEEMLPGLREQNRPFSVGYKEFPITHLPARDGQPHGKIKRSAGAPNCSFFTNWTSKQDQITWDIEVATSGTYEATLYYTCAKENLGSTVQLSFNDAKLQFKVEHAYNPPLHGKENDRFPRKRESFVKDFKPFVVGDIKLQAGRGLLTLEALNISGAEVMDVRYVVLTLKK